MSDTPRPPALPLRKQPHALACTLALALLLLALCWLAGATTYTNPQQRSAGVYEYNRQITHGYPFVGLTESSRIVYSPTHGQITQNGETAYGWQPGALLLDALLWIVIAAASYWLISDLFARVRSR